MAKADDDGTPKTRGQKLVERLQGKGDFGGMTTDEVIRSMRGDPADTDLPSRDDSVPPT